MEEEEEEEQKERKEEDPGQGRKRRSPLAIVEGIFKVGTSAYQAYDKFFKPDKTWDRLKSRVSELIDDALTEYHVIDLKGTLEAHKAVLEDLKDRAGRINDADRKPFLREIWMGLKAVEGDTHLFDVKSYESHFNWNMPVFSLYVSEVALKVFFIK